MVGAGPTIIICVYYCVQNTVLSLRTGDDLSTPRCAYVRNIPNVSLLDKH